MNENLKREIEGFQKQFESCVTSCKWSEAQVILKAMKRVIKTYTGK